jgi:hypothetical protein
LGVSSRRTKHSIPHLARSILSTSVDAGPHTALFILPQGRLLASVTRYDVLYDEITGEEADVAGLSLGETEAGVEGGQEEPYLDEPERIRLLCGLASQWEEDESPRVECEVSPSVTFNDW